MYRIFLDSTHHNKPEFWDDKRFNDPDQPVVGVSWHDAVVYCEWLTKSSSDGRVYRLPTGEEWEWAAGRGEREYPWSNKKPDHSSANYDNKIGHPTPIGSYPAGATPDGLMDMAGNVWEWTASVWEEDEDWRVLRGGSFNDGSVILRCSVRYWDPRDICWYFFGFRVACSAQSGNLGE